MEATPSATNKGRKSISSKKSTTKSIRSNNSVRKTLSADGSIKNKSQVTLIREEERTLIVNSVLQEVVTKAFQQIYENGLNKETVYFVSRCSRLAWRALVEWNYQRRYPGGYKEADMEDLDVEPATSTKDSWAGRSVQIGDRGAEGAQPRAPATKSDLGTTEATLTTITDTCKTTDPSESTMTRSATIKATEMARELVQIMRKRPRAKTVSEPAGRLGATMKSGSELKKDSYELPLPVVMQPKYFPPTRVEVDYSVVPGTRGVLSKKPPKTRTVHLKCLLPGEAEEAARAARRSRISQNMMLTPAPAGTDRTT